MPQFSRESARRIGKSVRRLESTPKDFARERHREVGRTAARRAIVTQAITPPSSATVTHTASAGWGFAQLQRWNDATSKYVNLGSPVRVINPWPATTTTAVAGRVIWVEFVDGVWQMPGENCA